MVKVRTVLIVGIFMIGIMSFAGLVSAADRNVCLDAGVSPTISSATYVYTNPVGSLSNIIDGESTYWGFYGGRYCDYTGARDVDILIDFSDTYDVSRMSIDSIGSYNEWALLPPSEDYEKIWLLSDGTWVLVGSRGAYHPRSVNSVTDFWPSVTAAKIEMAMLAEAAGGGFFETVGDTESMRLRLLGIRLFRLLLLWVVFRGYLLIGN